MHAPMPMPSAILSAVVPHDFESGPSVLHKKDGRDVSSDDALRGSSLRQGWKQFNSAVREAYHNSALPEKGRGPINYAFINSHRLAAQPPPEPSPSLPPSPKPLKSLRRRITPLCKH